MAGSQIGNGFRIHKRRTPRGACFPSTSEERTRTWGTLLGSAFARGANFFRTGISLTDCPVLRLLPTTALVFGKRQPSFGNPRRVAAGSQRAWSAQICV